MKDLVPGSFWQSGSQFLQLAEEDWPIKLSYHTDQLEGELVIDKQFYVAVVNIAHPDLLGRITNYCSSWRRMTRVLARITRLGMSFYPTPCGNWKNGKRYYEVRWADSWEPEENLELC